MGLFEHVIQYANTTCQTPTSKPSIQALEFLANAYNNKLGKTAKFRHDKTIPTTNIKTEKSSKYSKKLSPSFPKFIPVQNQNPKSQNCYFPR